MRDAASSCDGAAFNAKQLELTRMTDFIVKHWLTVVFGLITTALGAGYKVLSNRVKREREENKAIKGGVKALLADRIMEIYHKHTDMGYCPIPAKRNLEYLFNAYKSLGGNGTVTDLYQRLHAMPTEKKEE